MSAFGSAAGRVPPSPFVSRLREGEALTGNILVLPPCLLSPFSVYRGASAKDLVAASSVRELLLRRSGFQWLIYPCPELVLLGFPRPPASRELYERLGMREVAGRIAEFIARVVEEENPERVLLLGVKGSPTCGVHHTTSGELPPGDVEAFRRLGKQERQRASREISAHYRTVEGPGILFELLKGKVKGTYIEFDKDDIPGSIRSLEAALGGR